MTYDKNDELISVTTIYKLRQLVNDLIYLNNFDADEIYLKYCLNLRFKDARSTMRAHVFDWLYTVRCELGSGGLIFINTVLSALGQTMRRNITDVQFAYSKLLLDIFIKERKKF